MKKLMGILSVLMLSIIATGCAMVPGAEGAPEGGGTSTIFMYIGIMVVFFVVMYFIAIRPQKKQEKEQKALLESMRVGDTVLTTAGFYGVVIDITNDTVIVEFGNNKNCRIPMQRVAIVQVEHPEDAVADDLAAAPAETTDDSAKGKLKGIFGGLKKDAGKKEEPAEAEQTTETTEDEVKEEK